jgi:hypothetical protein
MTLKNAIVLLLLLACENLVHAQLSNIQGLDNVVIRTKKYEDIKGSAYLYTSWNSGTLTDRSGKVYSNLLLKYDSYKDQVELNQEGQVFEVSASMYPKFTLNYVEPTNNKVVKHLFSAAYNVEGFPKFSYFDLLFEGKFTLLRKYKTSFIEENVSGYGTSGAQKSFQSKILYFVINEDGVSKDIKPTKKSILEVFPEQTASIETYAKEQKMKLKSEADLIEIIRFLNEN